MLSKGQGNTNGTYTQLIKALGMDHRAEEAHQFWMKKFGKDLHSVPWQLCSAMISIYYRNNMLDHLVMVSFPYNLFSVICLPCSNLDIEMARNGMLQKAGPFYFSCSLLH